jgi:hypothetical protein
MEDHVQSVMQTLYVLAERLMSIVQTIQIRLQEVIRWMIAPVRTGGLVLMASNAQNVELDIGAKTEMIMNVLRIQIHLRKATSKQTVHALLATLVTMVQRALLAVRAHISKILAMHLAQIVEPILTLLTLLPMHQILAIIVLVTPSLPAALAV